MRPLRKRTMANEAAKQWQMMFLSTSTMANELLSTITMTNEFAKHKNNANEAAKQENDGK